MGFRLRPSAITYEKCIDSTLTACGLTVIDTSNGWLILTVNLNKIQNAVPIIGEIVVNLNSAFHWVNLSLGAGLQYIIQDFILSSSFYKSKIFLHISFHSIEFLTVTETVII